MQLRENLGHRCCCFHVLRLKTVWSVNNSLLDNIQYSTSWVDLNPSLLVPPPPRDFTDLGELQRVNIPILPLYPFFKKYMNAL